MKRETIRAHCPRCRHRQTFVKVKTNHWTHFVLSLLTGGLWLVSWLAISVGVFFRPWRCEHCGWYKPEFRADPLEPRENENGAAHEQAV